jgi:Rrf2 family protein
MSLYGAGVESGLHCLLYLVEPGDGHQPSSKDLAEFQGVSPSYVAKLFTQLEKAGIVESVEGIRGGFRLARPAERISILDVVDALEGDKPLFKCREIRRNCVLHEDDPPRWASRGVCAIHQIMLTAEQRMRATFESQTLADLAGDVNRKLPARYLERTDQWFRDRQSNRRGQGSRA